MIDWKAAARHFWFGRQLARQQEIRLKARSSAEHRRHAEFVEAMTVLLPRLAVYGEWCRACDSRVADGHRENCNYLQALSALRDATRSPLATTHGG